MVFVDVTGTNTPHTFPTIFITTSSDIEITQVRHIRE